MLNAYPEQQFSMSVFYYCKILNFLYLMLWHSAQIWIIIMKVLAILIPFLLFQPRDEMFIIKVIVERICFYPTIYQLLYSILVTSPVCLRWGLDTSCESLLDCTWFQYHTHYSVVEVSKQSFCQPLALSMSLIKNFSS